MTDQPVSSIEDEHASGAARYKSTFECTAARGRSDAMGIAKCQRQRPDVLSCSAELLSRAYTLPARWPFDALHLVMEFTPGQCDLYAQRASAFCCTLEGAHEASSRHQVTQSHTCSRRSHPFCRTASGDRLTAGVALSTSAPTMAG